jgi:hypothetical protein
MKRSHLLRKLAAAGISIGGAALLPQALEAACYHQFMPSGLEKITCCGVTVCCSTLWSGDQLLDQWCE